MSDLRLAFEERLSDIRRMLLFSRAVTNECEFNHPNTGTECSGPVRIFYFPRSKEFWNFCDNGADWNRERGHPCIMVVA